MLVQCGYAFSSQHWQCFHASQFRLNVGLPTKGRTAPLLSWEGRFGRQMSPQAQGLCLASHPIRGDAGRTALAGAPWPAPFPPGAAGQSVLAPRCEVQCSTPSKVLVVVWGRPGQPRSVGSSLILSRSSEAQPAPLLGVLSPKPGSCAFNCSLFSCKTRSCFPQTRNLSGVPWADLCIHIYGGGKPFDWILLWILGFLSSRRSWKMKAKGSNCWSLRVAGSPWAEWFGTTLQSSPRIPLLSRTGAAEQGRLPQLHRQTQQGCCCAVITAQHTGHPDPRTSYLIRFVRLKWENLQVRSLCRRVS